jgi:uncharacterized protein (DUF58 family)
VTLSQQDLPTKDLRWRAEQLAALLPPLLMRARRLASTQNSGAFGRKRPGPGDDFWQFRHSQPGDSLTHIDWRQSGKSDHLFVRESEWTIAHTTMLWADPSGSMHWRSNKNLETKFDRACLLVIATAFLLEQANERMALLNQTAPPYVGRIAPMRLADALFRQSRDNALPPEIATRRGKALVISDFLMPLELLAGHLRSWSAAGIEGHLLQILDPVEESLDFEGRVRLQGLEQEGDILLAHAQSLRLPYRQAVMNHRDGLEAMARQFGWRFSLHHTDRSARAALTHLYASLADR